MIYYLAKLFSNLLYCQYKFDKKYYLFDIDFNGTLY